MIKDIEQVPVEAMYNGRRWEVFHTQDSLTDPFERAEFVLHDRLDDRYAVAPDTEVAIVCQKCDSPKMDAGRWGDRYLCLGCHKAHQ